MKRRLAAIGVALALWAQASECWAWGATGHEWISGIAIEKLPDSVPAFIRTPEAAAEIAALDEAAEQHGVAIPAELWTKLFPDNVAA